LSILQGNSCSIDQKSGGIWTVQTDLQQIYPKSDRLLKTTNWQCALAEIRRMYSLLINDPNSSVWYAP
jgi:hypothetical protein